MTDDTGPGTERGSLDREHAHGLLNRVLGELPGVVYRCRNDPSWTLLGITANVGALTGYAASEFLQDDPVLVADLIHPEDKERVWSDVQEAVERGVPFRLTYRLRTRGGEERWVLEQGRATRDEGEDVLVGYIQDVTGPVANRLAESRDELARTRRQADHLSLLQSVTSIVNEERRLESALRKKEGGIRRRVCPEGSWRAAERSGSPT